jgi:hypothetical protein
MALPTTELANNPNLPADMGQAAAGMMKTVPQAILETAIPDGLNKAGVLLHGTTRVGFNAAGVSKANSGPNAAGQPKTNRAYTEYYESTPP